MAPVSIGFGSALIILGVASYLGTDRVSPTALIPAAFGLALLLLGCLAFKENLRKHAMHLAAMIGLVGLIAGLARLISKGINLQSTASVCTLLMTVLCAAFVLLCVRSFVMARRRRQAASTVEDVGVR